VVYADDYDAVLRRWNTAARKPRVEEVDFVGAGSKPAAFCELEGAVGRGEMAHKHK